MGEFPEDEERAILFTIEVFASPGTDPSEYVLGMAARLGMPSEELPEEIKKILDKTIIALMEDIHGVTGSSGYAIARGPGAATKRVAEYLRKQGMDVIQPDGGTNGETWH